MADCGLDGGGGGPVEYSGGIPNDSFRIYRQFLAFLRSSISGSLTFLSFWHSYVSQFRTLTFVSF